MLYIFIIDSSHICTVHQGSFQRKAEKVSCLAAVFFSQYIYITSSDPHSPLVLLLTNVPVPLILQWKMKILFISGRQKIIVFKAAAATEKAEWKRITTTWNNNNIIIVSNLTILRKYNNNNLIQQQSILFPCESSRGKARQGEMGMSRMWFSFYLMTEQTLSTL